MSRPVIISCAITGAGDTLGKHPAIPVTPQQIAQSALEAEKAGAAIVHIHVRDPATGQPTGDPKLFADVVARIRDAGSRVIINLTTGEGGMLPLRGHALTPELVKNELASADQRFAHVEDLKPEICSLDMGSMNLGGNLFLNVQGDVLRIAERAKARGVMPELEVFDSGHIMFSRELIKQGVIKAPAFFQLCLGVPGGAPATIEALLHLRGLLPEGALWAAFGIGPGQFPILAHTVAMGGHVRVGLEDNLYISRGVHASSNAALVEKAVKIIDLLEGHAATVAESRDMLGMR
jgi:uncharacterized protein (DUF849 family)